MKSKKFFVISLSVVMLIIVLTMIGMFVFTGEKKEEKLKIGFVMSGNTEESGWNGLHYQGIKDACQELDVELIVKEDIKEHSGQCEGAIRDLAKEDVEIIILSSYGYAEEVLDVVKEYPDITFYSECFDYYGDNLNCYFARIYQARYLSGIIAGMQTESDYIGYVAAMPNSEVNRGINAFTLGVKSVNPSATVVVAWSNSWDDVEEEKRLAQALIDEYNVDVLAYHQNQPNVVEVAETNNIYSIGYHETLEGVSEKYLTTVEFYWDVTYKELLLDYKKGKSDVVNSYWFGLEKETIGLADISPVVSQETIAVLDDKKEEIINGKGIFSGVIYDTEGTLRCDEGESISDDILMRNMDWYVEGVEFYED